MPAPPPRPGAGRLLVDEFQDLTPAHLLLIRLLAAPGYDCFGVGDDDQVIYGYSGATPEFLIDFPRYFPGAAHHPLEVDCRCPVGRRRGEQLSSPTTTAGWRRPSAGRTVAATTRRTPTGPLTGAGPVAVRAVAGDGMAA